MRRGCLFGGYIVKPAVSAWVVGLMCGGAIFAVAVTNEALLAAIVAGAFGAACMVFWDIRWAVRFGRYKIDLGDVAAFAGRYSFAIGDTVPLYVHTTAPAEARLYRFGARREDTGKVVQAGALRAIADPCPEKRI